VTAFSLAVPAEMKVTHEQMKAARIPLNFRDYCAHILIPLNECRVKTWYTPWNCTDLRHSYEKCQHDECAAIPIRLDRTLSKSTRAPTPRTRVSGRAALHLPAVPHRRVHFGPLAGTCGESRLLRWRSAAGALRRNERLGCFASLRARCGVAATRPHAR
jgi:NADH dehydrogenase (ubiquinone) 1 beta subcomplex subunit 7